MKTPEQMAEELASALKICRDVLLMGMGPYSDHKAGVLADETLKRYEAAKREQGEFNEQAAKEFFRGDDTIFKIRGVDREFGEKCFILGARWAFTKSDRNSSQSDTSGEKA